MRLLIIYDYLLLRLFEINHTSSQENTKHHKCWNYCQMKWLLWKEMCALSLTETFWPMCLRLDKHTHKHMPISWFMLSFRPLRHELCLDRKYFVIKCNWAFLPIPFTSLIFSLFFFRSFSGQNNLLCSLFGCAISFNVISFNQCFQNRLSHEKWIVFFLVENHNN